MKYIFLLACSQSISTFFWSNWESITAKQDYITDNENKTEQPCKVGVSWRFVCAIIDEVVRL